MAKQSGHNGPQIYISYEKCDENLFEKIHTHLRALQKSYSFKIFHNGDIMPGQDRQNEIKKAIYKSQVIIVLLSTNYLASETIKNEDLPHLLGRKVNKDCVFLIIPLKRVGANHELMGIEPVWPYANPLANMSAAKLDQALVEICGKIKNILTSMLTPELGLQSIENTSIYDLEPNKFKRYELFIRRHMKELILLSVLFVVLLCWRMSERHRYESKMEAEIFEQIFNSNYSYALTLLDAKSIRNSSSWMQRGYCYASLKQMEKARDAYQHAIDIDPRSWQTYYGYGVFLYRIGELDAALNYYLKAVELNPNDWRPLNGVGRIYLDRNLNNKAEEELRHALAKNYTSGEALKNLAWALLKQEKYSECLDQLNKFQQYNSGNLTAWDESELLYIRTNALAALGDVDEACKSLLSLSLTSVACVDGFPMKLRELQNEIGCGSIRTPQLDMKNNIIPITGAIIIDVTPGADLHFYDQPFRKPVIKEAHPHVLLGQNHELSLNQGETAQLLLSNSVLIKLKGPLTWNLTGFYRDEDILSRLPVDIYSKVTELGRDSLFYNDVMILVPKSRDSNLSEHKPYVFLPSGRKRLDNRFNLIFSPVEGAEGYRLTLKGSFPTISWDLTLDQLTADVPFSWFSDSKLRSFSMDLPSEVAVSESMSLTLTALSPSFEKGYWNDAVSEVVLHQTLSSDEIRAVREELVSIDQTPLEEGERLFLQARLYTRYKFYEEAIRAVEQLCSKNEDPNYALWLGELYVALGWDERAAICFWKAFNTADSLHVKAHALAGQSKIECNKGQFKEGLALIDKAIKILPRDVFRQMREEIVSEFEP